MPLPNKKYRKGYTIFGLDELMSRLDKGEWVYLRNKAVHPGFIMHMLLKTVSNFIATRMICVAIDQRKEYYAKMQEEYLAKLREVKEE